MVTAENKSFAEISLMFPSFKTWFLLSFFKKKLACILYNDPLYDENPTGRQYALGKTVKTPDRERQNCKLGADRIQEQLLTYKNWAILMSTFLSVPLCIVCHAVNLNLTWTYYFTGILISRQAGSSSVDSYPQVGSSSFYSYPQAGSSWCYLYPQAGSS